MLNIFRTCSRIRGGQGVPGLGRLHPRRKSTLPPREREIVILRTGLLCRSGYEWTSTCRSPAVPA